MEKNEAWGLVLVLFCYPVEVWVEHVEETRQKRFTWYLKIFRGHLIGSYLKYGSLLFCPYSFSSFADPSFPPFFCFFFPHKMMSNKKKYSIENT